jgi:hypothetical protein
VKLESSDVHVDASQISFSLSLSLSFSFCKSVSVRRKTG